MIKGPGAGSGTGTVPIRLADPDPEPGGPKTYGSYDSGSGSTTLVTTIQIFNL
jgi:hypothetical protein